MPKNWNKTESEEYVNSFAPRILIFFCFKQLGVLTGGWWKKRTFAGAASGFFNSISWRQAQRGEIKQMQCCVLKVIEWTKASPGTRSWARQQSKCYKEEMNPLKSRILKSKQLIHSPRSHRWPHPPLRLFGSTELAPTSLGCWLGIIPLPARIRVGRQTGSPLLSVKCCRQHVKNNIVNMLMLQGIYLVFHTAFS